MEPPSGNERHHMWKSLFDPERKPYVYTGSNPAARYLYRFGRFFPSLWKAGFLAFLSALPLVLLSNILSREYAYPGILAVCFPLLLVFSVPFSLTMTALTYFSCLAVLEREEPFFPAWIRCIRSNARQAVPIGTVFSFLLASGITAARILLSAPGSGSISMLVGILLILLLDLLIWLTARLQLLFVELKSGQILRNSLLLPGSSPKRFLLAAASAGLSSAVLILSYPVPGIFLVLIGFPGAASLAAVSALWPSFDRTFSVSSVYAPKDDVPEEA